MRIDLGTCGGLDSEGPHRSDRASLRGLTQFLTQFIDARPQIAEGKPIRATSGFKGGFCATLFRAFRKSLILKRRDGGVVDRARLESVAL